MKKVVKILHVWILHIKLDVFERKKKKVNFDPIDLSGAITPERVSIFCYNFFGSGWDVILLEYVGEKKVSMEG